MTKHDTLPNSQKRKAHRC